MDFVDLDKVLDEFEEEEKAADSLTPGQEVRPSGYSDFVESRRDKPWESVSEIPVAGNGVHPGYVITGKRVPGGSVYDYDIPYDAGGKNTEYIESAHLPNLKKNVSSIEYGKGDLNLGNSLDNSASSTLDSLEKQKANHEGHESDLYSEPEAGLTLSTSGQAEKEHLNDAVHDEFIFSRHNGISHEDYRSVEKGLKASQVIAVQTDALTPRTEKELSSVPFPKSDIIVDGHETTKSLPSYDSYSASGVSDGWNKDNQLAYAKVEPVKDKPDLQSMSVNERVSDEVKSSVDGQSVNGVDNNQVAAVGFGAVTDDINEEEINQYLNSDITDNTQNLETIDTKADRQNHVVPDNGMQNPDIVLDIGRSENLKSQKNDVQYSSGPASNDTNIPASGGQGDSLRFQHLPSISADTGSDVHRSAVVDAKASDTTLEVSKQISSEESSLSDVRESSSGRSSESSSSPSDQGSPQTLGIGARPKDPVALKTNRPNSLLGLSKLSMDPGFNIVHEVVEGTDSSKQGATNSNTDMSESVAESFIQSTVTGSLSAPPPSVDQKHLTNLEIRQQIEQEQRQRMNINSGGQGGPSSAGQLGMSSESGRPGQLGIASDNGQPMGNFGAQVQPGQLGMSSSIGQLGTSGEFGQPGMTNVNQQQVGLSTELGVSGSGGQLGGVSSAPQDIVLIDPGQGVGGTMDDMPVMRRGEEQFSQPGLDPQSGIPPRPHSWSPGSGQIAPPGKLKRPTSLNLPPRGEFGVAGDRSPDTGGRMRGVGMMKADQIPEESEQSDLSVVEEYSEGDGRLEGADGGDPSLLPSGDPPPPSIIHSHLGRVAPTWVPDNEAPNCMQCQARFTFTKRRHHCRACGKVFCSTCCNQKTPLPYMDMKEARVCQQCHTLLQSADWLSTGNWSPNPNNPSEYCSTVPPQQQANARAPLPTVLVPVGVLKREGSQRRAEPKQVMFSDGIRPGGDLTELDGSNETRLPPRRIGRMQKKVEKTSGGQSSPKTRRLRATENARNKCLIPDEGLPPLYKLTVKGDVSLEDKYNPEIHLTQAKNEEAEPVVFAINSNLQVLVKILSLDCCVNRECWSFTTRGMCTVGQEEIVIILECFPDEKQPPRDIFCHLATVYEEAGKGNTVTDMGHSIFNQSFLDSREHGGFLYLRATFQCMQKLLLPSPPYLFGILLQKWETPWAKVFPLRLLLRLGAEYRYYPCPLVSIRNRKPVFFEIGHTIMNLLADFRNYQYMLPQIRGVHIHMEDKKTVINFPRNRYDELMKMVNSSNEHVMALGSNFSPDADSHLVCIQNDEGNYQTQAINIQNKPRKVTGASFVVFNGALKTTSGLRAKSSIVEDGLMVQILPECMVSVKQSIKDMTDFTIGCGSVAADKPEEVVVLQWVDEDKNVNIGVKSPIDKMALDGVESIHIHNSTDYVGEHRAIRWTEVFFIQNEDTGARWEPVDLSRLAETLASATCIALSQHLDRLKEAQMTKIGLRVTIDTEQVGYDIGSNNEKLADFYMNDLDSGLIPVIHRAASQNQDGPIVLELLFYIIE